MTAYAFGILLCFLGLAPLATHLVVRGFSETVQTLRGVSTTWTGRGLRRLQDDRVAGLFFVVLSLF